MTSPKALPKRVVITSFSNKSESALELKKAFASRDLPVIFTKTKDSKFTSKVGDLHINWGCYGERVHDSALNHRASVRMATDKVRTFTQLEEFEVETPAFCTHKSTAESWLRAGKIVVARTVVDGNSGEGIVLCHQAGGFFTSNLPDAPLYTILEPKTHEYRIHVMNDQVILKQRKVLPNDHQGTPNWYIRSHPNGFLFQRERDDVVYPQAVLEQAVLAVRALGLYFGGVDVIFDEKTGVAKVLEVNTAPGVEPSAAERYVQKFLEFYAEQNPVKEVAPEAPQTTSETSNAYVGATVGSSQDNLPQGSLGAVMATLVQIQGTLADLTTTLNNLKK